MESKLNYLREKANKLKLPLSPKRTAPGFHPLDGVRSPLRMVTTKLPMQVTTPPPGYSRSPPIAGDNSS